MTDTALNYGANEESADWCDFRSQVLEFYNYHTDEYMASSEVADWGRPEDAPTATLVLDSDYGVTYRIPLVFCPIRREACIEVNGDPWEELCERSVYCWLWHQAASKAGKFERAEAAEDGAAVVPSRSPLRYQLERALKMVEMLADRSHAQEKKLAEAQAFLNFERGDRGGK